VTILRLTAALWMIGCAGAQDSGLRALQETLVSLRAHGNITPELTVAKHQLRDWIEAQLSSVVHDDDVEPLERRVNDALKDVDAPARPDDQILLGSIGNVRIQQEPGMLVVITGVGIPCQFDQSAYGYKRVDGRWKRVWETEQTDYAPEKYDPRFLTAVHVWQSYGKDQQAGPAYVMALGHSWGCSSNWHNVHYRVWRVDAASKLLLDRSESAWLRRGAFLVGSIKGDGIDEKAPIDVLVEFTQASIDPGVHNREAVRHFRIEGEKVHRIDPVALSPRDFVDEWLTRSWEESSAWSAFPRASIWHEKIKGGEFIDTTKRCRTPDLWQVGLSDEKFKPAFFFLVRWGPPYHFTMVNIADKPWPACTIDDPQADQWRTLFNTQEWRQ
jgi:hypothetical protein